MTTLCDLLGVHRDADDETLKWAFREALAANQGVGADHADPLLRSVLGSGILRDPEQRLVYGDLIAWERERLRLKSKRVALSSTVAACIAILLGTIAGGYGLLAPDVSNPPAAVADDGASTAATALAIGASSNAVTTAGEGAPAAAAVAENTYNAPASAAAPVNKDGVVPLALAVAGKAGDVPSPPSPAPRAAKTDEASPAPVKQPVDRLPVAAVTNHVDGISAAEGRPAETAATQPAGDTDPKAQTGARAQHDSAPGAHGKPATDPAKHGGEPAPGLSPHETGFRDAGYYRERGIASYRRGDFQQAISDLDEAIRLDRSNAQAYDVRGNVADEMGAFAQALADYDEAIRLDPDNVAPLDDRAVLWRRKGDPDKALLDLDQAVLSGLADAKVYCDRGLIRYEKGRLDLAAADFRQAVRLDATFATAYIRRGAILHRAGTFNIAFAAVYRPVRVDPKVFNVSRRPVRRSTPKLTAAPEPATPQFAPAAPLAIGPTEAWVPPPDFP